MSEKVPVSVIVPIKNEANNLERCLSALRWANEIFVVDSMSTDGSIEIAERMNAIIVQFEFNGTWPKKKNWALENLPLKNEWVLIVDADEVLPSASEEEVRNITTNAQEEAAGYWINRRFMFMGKWLKHSYYPNWNLRLFRHTLGRYEKITGVDTESGDNEVHEHVVVQGPTKHMQAEMDHYAFPSIEVFVEKHNRYSNWEARVALLHSKNHSDKLQNRGVKFRRRVKWMMIKMPFRPMLRFLYVYIWQRGFLDGKEGYYFARLHALYEFLSVVKMEELRKLRGQDEY